MVSVTTHLYTDRTIFGLFPLRLFFFFFEYLKPPYPFKLIKLSILTITHSHFTCQYKAVSLS